VEFTMPGWMARYDFPSRERQDAFYPDISVPYLFDRFEQVQNTGFRKNFKALSRSRNNPAIAQFDDSFPQAARLEYKEIEAGDIGGGYTDISFKVNNYVPEFGPEKYGEPPVVYKPEEERGPSMSALLANALAIANFVTRACRGEIRTWRGELGLMRSNDLEREGEEANDAPHHEKASSDSEVANAAEETESVETSDEMFSTDKETVEVADDEEIAKTSDEVSEVSRADHESVKASEEDIATQTSEENSGADIETANASSDIPGSDNKTAKTGDEDSEAEAHTRP
jgi:hypothetical protein